MDLNIGRQLVVAGAESAGHGWSSNEITPTMKAYGELCITNGLPRSKIEVEVMSLEYYRTAFFSPKLAPPVLDFCHAAVLRFSTVLPEGLGIPRVIVTPGTTECSLRLGSFIHVCHTSAHFISSGRIGS